VMDSVAAKVQATIVPYIGGSHGRRKLKINHTKVSDAFKFNFHEDEKAQYQPDYMEGAHKKKDDKGKKKRDRGASSKRKRGEDEEAGPSRVVPDWKK
jgi:hypothetical protein